MAMITPRFVSPLGMSGGFSGGAKMVGGGSSTGSTKPRVGDKSSTLQPGGPDWKSGLGVLALIGALGAAFYWSQKTEDGGDTHEPAQTAPIDAGTKKVPSVPDYHRSSRSKIQERFMRMQRETLEQQREAYFPEEELSSIIEKIKNNGFAEW